MRKPEPSICPECGAKVEWKVVNNYTSAQELGRPRGAKGRDDSYMSCLCPVHGQVTPVVDPSAQAEYDAWIEWIDNLPDQLDEWTHVDKIRRGLTDHIGNWLCGLPPRPVEDLKAWAMEYLDFDFGD